MSQSISEADAPRFGIPRTAILVILLGIVIRGYSCAYIPLVNPDGHLYIQQAKALHYGLWDSVTACYHYLSNYPLLIVAAHQIFEDWILAAKSISLVFSALTLIPLFWLLRRFFDDIASSLALMIFALLPAFVDLSHFIVRDHVYHFFSVLGLYLFVLQIKKESNLLIFLSGISFLMATWGRIEGALFILVSGFYILISKHEHKRKRLFFFLCPLLCIIFSALFYLVLFNREHFTLFDYRILTMPFELIERYQEVREKLSYLMKHDLTDLSPYFLYRIRNMLWLIALASLCFEIIKTLFHVFFLIFILGIAGARAQVWKDPRVAYLSLLSAAAFVLLYAQVINNWVMVSRFIALFLFPAYIFMGFGLEKTANFISQRFKKKQHAVYPILCLLILLTTLPKNLRANYDEDKLVFREIGQYIAAQEENRREISVIGSFKETAAIHFYANLDYEGAPCFENEDLISKGDLVIDPGILKDRRADYLIWDERGMSRETLNRLLDDDRKRFTPLKEWRSSDRGRLILFRVTGPEKDAGFFPKRRVFS